MVSVGRENGYLTEVVSLVEGEWFTEVITGQKMVMLQRWSLMEGEWSCYGGGQFNGGRKVMLGGQFNGGRMVVTEVVSLM